MNRVIFISNLTVWSIKKGFGGPAFWQTLLKYSNENVKVTLISDEPTNINCDNGLFENIVLRPSKFKKYCQVRIIGPVFRYFDHKYITKQYFNSAKQLLEKNADETILYAYEVWGVSACKKLSHKYQIPFVTRFQGTVLSSYKDSIINRIRKYPHFNALATKSDLVIMTDDGTQGDQVLKRLKNKSSKILFLRNGLELLSLDINAMKTSFNRNCFRSNLFNSINDEDTVFLTVSRLVKWKHVERAIQGFADFCDRGGCGKLVIVGDGEEKPFLTELCRKLNVSDKIRFVGAVKHEEVYNFMMACDIFLSLYDLSNVGNPLLEAMTLGKPIITLNVGDTDKVIVNRENGILLNVEELDTLGNIMIEVASDARLRKSLAYKASQYAQENFYSWEKRMDKEYNMVSLLTCDDSQKLDTGGV